MDNKIITAVVEMTSQFVRGIDDKPYEAFLPFLDQREKLIQQLKQIIGNSELANENKALMDSIMPLNMIIMAKLRELKNEAAVHLGKIEQAKVQKQGYEVHYSSDAAYFDKRIGT